MPWIVLILSLSSPGTEAKVTVRCDGAPPRLALALQRAMEGELSRFAGVRLVEPEAAALGCDDRDCLLLALRGQGVDLLAACTLSGDRLSYDLLETSTGRRHDSGSIFAGKGSAGGRLEHDLAAFGRAVARFERPAPPALDVAPRLVHPAPAHALDWVLGALLVLLALPYFGLVRLVGFARRPRSLLPSGLCMLLIGAALVLHHTAGLPALPPTLLAVLSWVEPLAGGLFWTAAALLYLRLVAPALAGLERVTYFALLPLLRTWSYVLIQRALLLLLLLPVGFGVLVLGAWVGLSTSFTWTLVMPAVLLLLYYLWLAWSEVLAIYLDQELVSGAATEDNPWQVSARRYYVAYAERFGLELDPRVLFLPGLTDNVFTYGGGFARPRIVVSTTLLEAALGSLAAEPLSEAERIDLDSMAVGMVMPRTEATTVVPFRPVAAPPRRKPIAPRLLGENVTLLGYVMPQAVSDTVPLISNNSEDFDVVRSLLTEHYAAFEKHDEDDDDARDPSQRDYLFGLLVRELGVVQRRDGLGLGFFHAAHAWSQGATRLTRWLMSLWQRLYARFESRYPAALADAHAALHGARDHLMQYLHYVRAWNEEGLTAKADPPRLLRASIDILRRIEKQPPEGDERHAGRATPYSRMQSLGAFFQTPLVRRRRWWLVILVSLLVVTSLTVAALDAVSYHPIFEERMQDLKMKAQAAKEEKS